MSELERRRGEAGSDLHATGSDLPAAAKVDVKVKKEES